MQINCLRKKLEWEDKRVSIIDGIENMITTICNSPIVSIAYWNEIDDADLWKTTLSSKKNENLFDGDSRYAWSTPKMKE